MTRLTLAKAAWLATVALAAPMSPATATDCVEESIAQCDKRYGGDKPWLLPLRGYCYLILIAGCPDAT